MVDMQLFYISKRLLQIAIIVIMVIVISGVARADIFMYKDSKGVLHLGNKPDAKKKGKLFLKETQRYYPATGKNALAIVKLIEKTAKKHNVDPDLAKAIAKAESSFQTDVVSPKGAVGVMQLMPATAKRFKVKDRYHPGDNIDAGIRYLKILTNKFPSDIKLAVAAYNAGENRVVRSGNKIPNIKETKDYVERVMRFYSIYKGKNPEQWSKPVFNRPVKKKVRQDGTIVLSNL